MYCSHSEASKLYASLRFFKTCGETALSASNGPPGASFIKKKVRLATASNTGIASSNLLIKIFNTKV